jgi:hypothetical protein
MAIYVDFFSVSQLPNRTDDDSNNYDNTVSLEIWNLSDLLTGCVLLSDNDNKKGRWCCDWKNIMMILFNVD